MVETRVGAEGPHARAPRGPAPIHIEERERQKQQRRGKKAERQRIRRLKQRQRMSASRTEAQGSFHAATLKAVARVSRERETRAPAVIARELGIGEATAARYLAELERGR